MSNTSPPSQLLHARKKMERSPRQAGHVHMEAHKGQSWEQAVCRCLTHQALRGMSAEPSTHPVLAQRTVPPATPGCPRLHSEDRLALMFHSARHMSRSSRGVQPGGQNPRSSCTPRNAADCEWRRLHHGQASQDRSMVEVLRRMIKGQRAGTRLVRLPQHKTGMFFGLHCRRRREVRSLIKLVNRVM